MKPKLDKDGWPLEWQMLEAEDMCRGVYGYAGTRCALGWLFTNLYGKARPEETEFFSGNARRETVFAEHFLRAAQFLSVSGNVISQSVVETNDFRENSLSLIARSSNLAAAMLGYMVGNPEASTLSTLRKMEAK